MPNSGMAADPGESRAYLVDASVYVFRAYYSIEPSFFDREGNPSHAVYGFVGFLCTVLDQARPSHLAVCFDEALESSFRNEIYPDYKANREPAPPELRRQFAHCRAVAEALGIDCFSDAEYEADDLIGTLARRRREAGQRITVLSSDKDLVQVLQGGDEWWDFARQRRLDPAGVEATFGVRPEQMADFLALTGDPVDNIPGVSGIGPKSAAAILAHFGSVDTLIERLDELQFLSFRGAKSAHRRIRDGLEDLRTARRLTRIRDDAPIPEPVPDLRRRPADDAALDELFDFLDFGRLLRERCAAVSR
ncbi:MAG: 5'-3' exonuclease H3TH domain-containing protein [Xanthomonadales bacterium]|nr:5'-3' exonuclease H3TH domain-containing protein [Xanthomonadales bacterium]